MVRYSSPVEHRRYNRSRKPHIADNELSIAALARRSHSWWIYSSAVGQLRNSLVITLSYSYFMIISLKYICMKPIDVLLRECWFEIYEKEIIVNRIVEIQKYDILFCSFIISRLSSIIVLSYVLLSQIVW